MENQLLGNVLIILFSAYVIQCFIGSLRLAKLRGYKFSDNLLVKGYYLLALLLSWLYSPIVIFEPLVNGTRYDPILGDRKIWRVFFCPW